MNRILFFIVLGLIGFSSESKAQELSQSEGVGVDSTLYLGYFTSNNLPVNILWEGFYHGDENNLNELEKERFGLFKKNNSYYLAPTKLEVAPAYDGVNGNEYENKSTWSGLDIKSTNKDTALILMNNIPHLLKADIKAVRIEKDEYWSRLAPNESIVLNYGNNSYSLLASDLIKNDPVYNDDYPVCKYSFQGLKNGRKITQVLGIIPFDEYDKFNNFKFLFVGDIDGDGLPDLLVDASEYNIYRLALYLSSFAEDGELVKLVGVIDTYGC